MNTVLDGFQHRLVNAGGVKIHTVSGGAGTPIVLLHGFPQTWWEWRKIMPDLANRHTVVAVDLRGAGFSDCPQGGYDKVTMAADIHAAMTGLGHSRYAVCGHDIGAMVAVALAATHREAVTHLAVLDVPMPGWSEWETTAAKLWHFGFHMNRDLPERLIQGREYDYVSSFISERLFDHGAHDPDDIEIFARALAQPGRTRGGMEWYRAFPTDHRTALTWKADPLMMPVLALGGDQRFGPRMVGMMQEFASDVRGGSVPNASHYIADERPKEVLAALVALLT
ncbi:alpha/beta fold hydrolase [Acidisphaera sp. L21]|uniref:alpha/beta fold hydrolase n=1 Tax=Acidisphaera sp. L21 TaxID=1641851 RepID=UPI00131C7997|nr:alpha/beta hydrolase [Acidisphaera sp. L21]